MAITARPQPVRQGGGPPSSGAPRRPVAPPEGPHRQRRRCAATWPRRPPDRRQRRGARRPTRRRTPCTRSRRRHGVGATEDFGLRWPGTSPVRSRDHHGARIEIDEHGWDRIPAAASRTTRVQPRRRRAAHRRRHRRRGRPRVVVSGLTDLVLLKSTGSEFCGFPRDRYTTLAETRDRILATAVTAWWRYQGDGRRLGGEPTAEARRHLLETFADDAQPLAAADAVRDGRGGAGGPARGGRGPAVAAEQAPLPGGPEPVRAEERQTRCTTPPTGRTG